MFIDNPDLLLRHGLFAAQADAGGGEGDGAGGGEGAAAPPDDGTVAGSGASDAPAPNTDWQALRGSLPTELRDNPILDQFNEGGFEALAKDRITLDPLLGREKVPLLGKDPTPEERDRFYTALGRPAKPEDYDLGDFKPPEGLPWDANLQTQMMSKLHAQGLTNEQVNGVIRDFASVQAETYSANTQQLIQRAQQVEAALRQEHGEGYDAFVELAGRAFKEAFGEDMLQAEAIQLPDGYQLGDHPLVVRAFGRLGAKMGEHGALAPGTTTTGAQQMTPAAALEEIATMEHPGSKTAQILANASDPEHKAVKARWRSLYQIAYPESPTPG